MVKLKFILLTEIRIELFFYWYFKPISLIWTMLHILQIGNALIDVLTGDKGQLDFLWTHALISYATYEGYKYYCILHQNLSDQCLTYQSKSYDEVGLIYIYNIYGQPFCHHPLLRNGSISSVRKFHFSTLGFIDDFKPSS